MPCKTLKDHQETVKSEWIFTSVWPLDMHKSPFHFKDKGGSNIYMYMYIVLWINIYIYTLTEYLPIHICTYCVIGASWQALLLIILDMHPSHCIQVTRTVLLLGKALYTKIPIHLIVICKALLEASSHIWRNISLPPPPNNHFLGVIMRIVCIIKWFSRNIIINVIYVTSF